MADLFAGSFKDDFLADFDLYLISEDVAEPLDGQVPPVSRGPTPVHGVLLMASSEHFRVKIKGPFGRPPADKGSRQRLFIQVSMQSGP